MQITGSNAEQRKTQITTAWAKAVGLLVRLFGTLTTAPYPPTPTLYNLQLTGFPQNFVRLTAKESLLGNAVFHQDISGGNIQNLMYLGNRQTPNPLL